MVLVPLAATKTICDRLFSTRVGSYGVGPMTQSTEAILRFGRGTVIAATIVGTSGLLEAAGLPSLSGIVQNIGAAQTEARRLRDKTARTSGIRETTTTRGTDAFESS